MGKQVDARTHLWKQPMLSYNYEILHLENCTSEKEIIFFLKVPYIFMIKYMRMMRKK